MSENQELKISDEIINDLKEKYKDYPLFQITDTVSGDNFIIRGSNWDEFARVGNVQPGKENRVPLNMVKAFVVWPEIDQQDIEYNQTGNWQPGRIVALAEQIQEVLGYSKAFAVKKL
ncbi:MAG: hypothetical protein HN356_01510 [Calditrichaeota bacterium]|jgi:hypothetical protein|nr:hypothetical protein [Calditrichota bacterium]MBT7618482.1 hypothetical protein [Calditrichota bacterium]MBT7788171.1 hypothetical protein [Calditrichota bacterium]